MKRPLITAVVVLAIVGLVVWWKVITRETPVIISNFDECVAAGNPVMFSYPGQCKTDSGEIFVQNVGNEMEKTDFIRVSNPRPNQTITSPLAITGEARGTWFFEANLPITLLDQDGNIITRHYAMATGEWMTEEFVPFSGILEFEVPEGVVSGTLIVHKDNPSDFRELDDQIEIPVTFGKSSGSSPKDRCRATGCSGQVCADEDVMTTCEWTPVYGCYSKYGVCELQENEECGWTPSQELRSCVDSRGEEFMKSGLPSNNIN